jgi:ubiquinone/menaquinone biosynthesis C-methylase UbiE
VSTATPISTSELRQLHPRAIDSRPFILGLLEDLASTGARLWRSTNRLSEKETAWITEVTEEEFSIQTENFPAQLGSQLFLNFEISGQPYFMSAPVRECLPNSTVRLSLPAVVYQAERRDRQRTPTQGARVTLLTSDKQRVDALLADLSADGLAVDAPLDFHIERGSWVRVVGSLPTLLSSSGKGGFAEVRNIRQSPSGTKRVGLAFTGQRSTESVRIERADLRLASEPCRPTGTLGAEVPLIRFRNSDSESICAIVDAYGDPRAGTAVVIPPAWGRTKETLLPLAATILETFRSVDSPVCVVRFDGIRKKGESHIDPENRKPGLENLKFTFSQGAQDIGSTLEFLERSGIQPSRTILITFSVSSIEGRRAMAMAGERLAGWISVVGSADAQSLTRIISGGVDFFGGAERGVTFGLQEIQGLLVDMDHAASDALRNRIAFLDDSRRDFSAISAPITWIHGEHDAWMDLDRVRHALRFGNASNRKLLIVPTGHQLRTSEEAMSTFGLIAQEVASLALGRSVTPRRPDPLDLATRSHAERARLQRPKVDLRRFWRDYLVGRSGNAGIALVASTSPYRVLMEMQTRALALEAGQRVADLGCGIGTFATHVSERIDESGKIQITALDYVRDALETGRLRCAGRPPGLSPNAAWLQASLDLDGLTRSIPLADESQDSVLLSLVINYVQQPKALLREAARILKAEGRMVLSSLKRDADISSICVDAVAELKQGRGREALGEEGERKLVAALQTFIGDASRLLDLEEAGFFRFWDEEELVRLVEDSGFWVEATSKGLGSVPQAYVIRAQKRA